jgi:hypothetical protein
LTCLAEGTSGLLEGRREGFGLASPVSRMLKKNTLSVPPRRKTSKWRTFRDIVQHHPRGDGRPGHLVVEKIVALAGAMGEHPLHVLADLLTEAAANKRRKRKK